MESSRQFELQGFLFCFLLTINTWYGYMFIREVFKELCLVDRYCLINPVTNLFFSEDLGAVVLIEGDNAALV